MDLGAALLDRPPPHSWTGVHNASIRKVTKKREAFPTPDSVRRVVYLAIRRASERWSRPLKDWSRALNHFAIVFEGRVPQ